MFRTPEEMRAHLTRCHKLTPNGNRQRMCMHCVQVKSMSEGAVKCDECRARAAVDLPSFIKKRRTEER